MAPVDEDLYSVEHYCVATFESTQHALRAEMLLNWLGCQFIVIPTPREITADCGLSIKMRCEEREAIQETLAAHRVKVQGIYEMARESKHSRAVRVLAEIRSKRVTLEKK